MLSYAHFLHAYLHTSDHLPIRSTMFGAIDTPLRALVRHRAPWYSEPAAAFPDQHLRHLLSTSQSARYFISLGDPEACNQAVTVASARRFSPHLACACVFVEPHESQGAAEQCTQRCTMAFGALCDHLVPPSQVFSSSVLTAARKARAPRERASRPLPLSRRSRRTPTWRASRPLSMPSPRSSRQPARTCLVARAHLIHTDASKEHFGDKSFLGVPLSMAKYHWNKILTRG
jgi:hypothetical protein